MIDNALRVFTATCGGNCEVRKVLEELENTIFCRSPNAFGKRGSICFTIYILLTSLEGTLWSYYAGEISSPSISQIKEAADLLINVFWESISFKHANVTAPFFEALRAHGKMPAS